MFEVLHHHPYYYKSDFFIFLTQAEALRKRTDARIQGNVFLILSTLMSTNEGACAVIYHRQTTSIGIETYHIGSMPSGCHVATSLSLSRRCASRSTYQRGWAWETHVLVAINGDRHGGKAVIACGVCVVVVLFDAFIGRPILPHG